MILFLTNIGVIVKENIEIVIILVSCLIGISIYFYNANEQMLAFLQRIPISNAFFVDQNSIALFIILCCPSKD